MWVEDFSVWHERSPLEGCYCARDIIKTHYVQAWIMRVINVWINQRKPFLIFFPYCKTNPFNAAGEINQKYLNFLLWNSRHHRSVWTAKSQLVMNGAPVHQNDFLCFQFSNFQLVFSWLHPHSTFTSAFSLKCSINIDKK